MRCAKRCNLPSTFCVNNVQNDGGSLIVVDTPELTIHKTIIANGNLHKLPKSRMKFLCNIDGKVIPQRVLLA